MQAERLDFFTTIATLAALAVVPICSAQVLYVNADLATGSGTGTSWSDAYRGPDALARALAAATPGQQVWVARGRYVPTLSGDRAASFVPRSGITLLGGFTGTESAASQRDPVANVTLLSGDLLSNDAAWPSTAGRGENSHHVISATSTGHSGTLDGFVISGGYANVGGQGLDSDKGGGMIVLGGAAPAVLNCRLINNRSTFGGGAVYIRQSSPTFTDCALSFNIGGTYGGACDMANFCNPVWTRCRIEGNTAGRAGGIEVFGSSQPVFANCLFINNTATNTATGTPRGGGGLYIQQSTVTIRNCTLAGNSSAFGGGGILNSSGSVRVANSILWDNRGPASATTGQQLSGSAFNALHCIVQGGYAAGASILTADPMFQPGTYTLAAGSPAIDAGNNAEAGSDQLDLTGAPRKIDDPRRTDTGVGGSPLVDIGCFERPYTCPADIAGTAGTPGADGVLDNNDFVLFIDRFFAQSPTADMASSGGAPGADGQFDNNDFIAFIDAFFTPCL